MVATRLSAGAGPGRAARALSMLARRPTLWPTAVHQVGVLAPPGWWRRWPPAPVPDRAYLRFRLEVAYGDNRRVPEAGDVVEYLQWCRQMRRLRSR